MTKQSNKIVDALYALRNAFIQAGYKPPEALLFDPETIVALERDLSPVYFDQFGPKPPVQKKLIGFVLKANTPFSAHLIDTHLLTRSAIELGRLMKAKEDLEKEPDSADKDLEKVKILCDSSVVAVAAFRHAYRLVSDHNERERNASLTS